VRDLVFLVTGAADGVGLQLVARLAADGRRVLATDLDNHRLEEAARVAAWPTDLVRLAPLDVREPRGWAAAFALARRAFGGVDVLVHAAVPLRATEAAGAELDGAAQALEASATHMLPAGGHVVVIAPGQALHAPIRATCAATDATLRPQGLAITAVCTGAIACLENGLALRAAAACPAHGARVSAERVVDTVLGRVLEARPRQAFLPAFAGWATWLGELFPAVTARLRGRARPVAKVAARAAAPAQRA
jgi:NAD(P)-dependent dehydrogenase (short-subunit alcohol dehydrogenase family)